MRFILAIVYATFKPFCLSIKNGIVSPEFCNGIRRHIPPDLRIIIPVPVVMQPCLGVKVLAGETKIALNISNQNGGLPRMGKYPASHTVLACGWSKKLLREAPKVNRFMEKITIPGNFPPGKTPHWPKGFGQFQIPP